MNDKSWKEAMACSQAIMEYMINMEKHKEKLNALSREKETQKLSPKRKVQEMGSQKLDDIVVLHEGKKVCSAIDCSLKRKIIFVDSSEDELPGPKKLILDCSKASRSFALLPKKDTNVNKDVDDSQDKSSIQDKEDEPQDDPNDFDKHSNEKACEEHLTEEEILQLEDMDTGIDSSKTSIWLVRTMRKLEGYPELQQGLSSLVSDFPGSERGLRWLAKLSREDSIENVSKLLRNHRLRTQKSQSENSVVKKCNENESVAFSQNITEIVEHQKISPTSRKISNASDNTDEKHSAQEKTKPNLPFQLVTVLETKEQISNSPSKEEIQDDAVDLTVHVESPFPETHQQTVTALNLPERECNAEDNSASTESKKKERSSSHVTPEKSEIVQGVSNLLENYASEGIIVPQKPMMKTFANSSSESKPIYLNELSGFPEIQEDLSSIIQELPRENAVLDDSVSMQLLQKLKKLQVINEKVSAALVSPHQLGEKPVINLYVVQKESDEHKSPSEMKVDLSSTKRKPSVISWALSSIFSYFIVLVLHFGICVFLKEYLK